MRQLLRSLATAFSMYSSIPVPRVEWREENMRYVMCFFPLVGVVTGPAIWCWLWLCRQFGVGAPLAAVVCTALPVLVSGGIHLDGFCDTVDAFERAWREQVGRICCALAEQSARVVRVYAGIPTILKDA